MSKTWEIVCPTCGEQIEVYGDEDWIRLYELERKNWKHKAHQAFDAIWKSGIVERELAYSWLARELGIEYADCHFSEMSIPQLKQSIEICELAKARMLKALCETEYRVHRREVPSSTGKWARNSVKTTGVDMCTPIT